MSSFIKAILVVAGICFFLVVAAGVGGYLWIKHNKAALIGSAKAVLEEGKHFGAATDSNGCLTEAVNRLKKDDGIKSQIKIGLFLRSCLNTGKPSDGFCNEVPPEMEIIKSAAWRIQMCRKYGLKDSHHILFQNVQKYCEECRKKTQ
jgi:hypothetical protein